ncbi:MAG: TrkH family potassium uptake protein [Tannerella sp.]|jgi:trk system potassium uptake protein TrkH|nr:TrkH family potassium uptake protein [Tannerella sp.]
MKINYLYIIKSLGSILALETFFLLVAAFVAFVYGGDDVVPLLISAGIMSGAGVILFLIGRKANEYQAGRREGMLTVALTWIVLSCFGMLPYLIGGYINNVTDAFFETISGYTTTGATIINDLDSMPKGILFWRSLTQWQGGMGVIVFTVALLPMFGGGVSHLYDSETTGFSHERFRPRVTQVAKRLSGIYLAFTAIITFLLWLGPMDLFDAANHAMSSVSTGGFSTKNDSVAFWNSAYIEYVLIFSMCVGSLKLALIYFAFKGNFKRLRNDEETRWFLLYILFFIVVTVAWLFYKNYDSSTDNVEETIRRAAFQVVSLASTTGLTVVDYVAWGQFFWLIAVVLMLVCGCGGSTSGGIKMGRAMIVVKNMMNEFRKQTHPAAVLPVRVNGRAITQDTIHRVNVFVLVYLLIIVFSWAILLMHGLSFDEALGTAMTAISNVGPSLGLFESGNVYDIPASAKWYVSFLMLTGRLELFTVITLLIPGFWRR